MQTSKGGADRVRRAGLVLALVAVGTSAAGCGALRGLEYVHQESASDSDPVKLTVAHCPAGKEGHRRGSLHRSPGAGARVDPQRAHHGGRRLACPCGGGRSVRLGLEGSARPPSARRWTLDAPEGRRAAAPGLRTPRSRQYGTASARPADREPGRAAPLSLQTRVERRLHRAPARSAGIARTARRARAAAPAAVGRVSRAAGAASPMARRACPTAPGDAARADAAAGEDGQPRALGVPGRVGEKGLEVGLSSPVEHRVRGLAGW